MFARNMFSLRSSSKFIRNSIFKLKVNTFGSKEHDAHHHGAHGHNDHHHNDGHGHGGHDDHGHGHHEISGEVDVNRIYVPLNRNMNKFKSLTGLPADNSQHVTVQGESKAFNAITPIAIPLLTRNRRNFRKLEDVPNEENNYFHPEPYGYLFGDDPFDPNPHIHQRFIAFIFFFFGIFAVRRLLKHTDHSSISNKVENLYHAYFTSCQLEDEIRQIRREDYPYRKKYADLKNELTGASEEPAAAEEEESE